MTTVEKFTIEPEKPLESELLEWVTKIRNEDPLSAAQKLLAIRQTQNLILQILCAGRRTFTELKDLLRLHPESLRRCLEDLRYYDLLTKDETSLKTYGESEFTRASLEWVHWALPRLESYQKKRISKNLKRLHQVHVAKRRLLRQVEFYLEDHVLQPLRGYLWEFLLALTRAVDRAECHQDVVAACRDTQAFLSFYSAHLSSISFAPLQEIARKVVISISIQAGNVGEHS